MRFKFSKEVILVLIITIFPLQVFANTPDSKEIIDNLVLEVEYPEVVSYGENITATITLSQVLDYKIGTAQWIMDKKPIEGYYFGDFDLFSGKTVKLNLPINFSKDMPDGALMGFDIVLNDNLKRIEFYVDFKNYDDEFYKNLNIERVLNLIKPVEIDATIKYNTSGFSDKNLTNKTQSFNTGESVKYIDHNETYSAYIKKSDGLYYWVPYWSINISTKNYTIFSDFAGPDKETFVNAKNYSSETFYLIWINIERQKVNVFLGKQNEWKIIKEFTCASGANTTPTPVGQYKYSAKMASWKYPTFYVKPILYFDTGRGLAFHSRLYGYNNKLVDSTIGTPVSHGCIRMFDDDLTWLDNYIPKGTTVIVF